MVAKHGLILREEFRIRVFENGFLKRIFEPKRDENGDGESSLMRNFIVCTVYLNLEDQYNRIAVFNNGI
jgi:hypothetical protein